ncbi:MAG: flagellar basal body-associated FliL family protein [Syntrophomonadaceae bacterium]
MAQEVSEEVSTSKSGFDFKIIAIGLVIFLIAMGASYFMMKSFMAPFMPKEDNGVKGIENGNLVSVGEFTTNINDVAGTRYLKVEVFVQIGDKKVKNSIEEYMPVIKDSILTIISSKTAADLEVGNRNNLKAEIKKDLNSKIGSNTIQNVYFTNFIMQ